MPKPHSFPTLYDEALQINISRLKEWGYLNPRQIKSGTLHWSRNGVKIGSISIVVNNRFYQPYIILDYNYKDIPRNYKLNLVTLPSNLGKGDIWYFECPHTHKRCRKLYSINGYFLHRKAFKGCMYESQTRSKFSRVIDKSYGTYFKLDRLYEQLYKKHFKKTYRGKPTKKYLKIKKQIEFAESIPFHEIERILLY